MPAHGALLENKVDAGGIALAGSHTRCPGHLCARLALRSSPSGREGKKRLEDGNRRFEGARPSSPPTAGSDKALDCLHVARALPWAAHFDRTE